MCDSDFKQLVFPVAMGALVLYAAGVPFGLYRRLLEHREVLQSEAAEYQLGFLCQLHPVFPPFRVSLLGHHQVTCLSSTCPTPRPL